MQKTWCAPSYPSMTGTRLMLPAASFMFVPILYFYVFVPSIKKVAARNMEETQVDALVLTGLVIALWLLSVRLRCNWPADLIWPVWPLLHAILILRRMWPADMGCHYVRKLIVLFLLGQWTHQLVSLRAMRGEDWRWVLLRERLGASHLWCKSFLVMYVGQAAVVFLGSSSLYAALEANQNLRPDKDPAACFLCGAGILLETCADVHMERFRRDRLKREGNDTMFVLQTGLWAWCRHPNYLGQIFWWWGLHMFGAGFAREWTTIGPVLITCLILFGSSHLIETRLIRSKKGECARLSAPSSRFACLSARATSSCRSCAPHTPWRPLWIHTHQSPPPAPHAKLPSRSAQTSPTCAVCRAQSSLSPRSWAGGLG